MKGKSVVVIGAGFSGMLCALILARYGCKATLVERAARPGFGVRGFMRDDVYFDTGLHYVGGLEDTGVMQRILRFLGLADLPKISFNADCYDEIRLHGTRDPVRFAVGFEALKRSLCARCPGEEGAVSAYLEKCRNVFAASPLMNFAFATQTALRAGGGTLSLAGFLDSVTSNLHLKAALSAHTLLHGVAPADVPFTQHAYVAASYFDSVHAFAGGGRTVVEALEQRLAQAGISPVCGKAVRGMCGSGGKLDRVVLEDGQSLSADAFICTSHPAALADMAPAGMLRPAFVHRLRALEETPSAYMLFGVAETVPACLRGQNLFVIGEGVKTLRSGPAEEESPLFYASCSPRAIAPDVKNPRHGIVVISPGDIQDVEPWKDSTHASRPDAYKRFKAARLSALREALVRVCPELTGVDFIDGATPLTLRDYLRAPRGGLYGCKHTVSQFNPLPVTRVPNLFLAGQSVVAPGLLGTCLSAFLACGFLVGHKRLREDVLWN
jgi:all-trans-retinol 13,14-reductase